MLTCEILVTTHTAMRGERMLKALAESAESANVSVSIVSQYSGETDWLMLYGAGGADRHGPFMAHAASGRRAICWDLGYWDRQHMMRVSIDAMHPQEWIWRKPLASERFDSCGIRLRSTSDENGPIVFAGMGRKSKALYGAWDEIAIGRLRRRFKGRQIVVRSKPSKSSDPDVQCIESIIDGASLVVTRHSNVAIDAIIAGITFECEDGAAMAYRGDRVAFLRQLAWFQWRAEEAREAWRFLRDLTGE